MCEKCELLEKRLANVERVVAALGGVPDFFLVKLTTEFYHANKSLGATFNVERVKSGGLRELFYRAEESKNG